MIVVTPGFIDYFITICKYKGPAISRPFYMILLQLYLATEIFAVYLPVDVFAVSI